MSQHMHWRPSSQVRTCVIVRANLITLECTRAWLQSFNVCQMIQSYIRTCICMLRACLTVSSLVTADCGGRFKPWAHLEAGQPYRGNIQLHPLRHQQQLTEELWHDSAQSASWWESTSTCTVCCSHTLVYICMYVCTYVHTYVRMWCIEAFFKVCVYCVCALHTYVHTVLCEVCTTYHLIVL